MCEELLCDLLVKCLRPYRYLRSKGKVGKMIFNHSFLVPSTIRWVDKSLIIDPVLTHGGHGCPLFGIGAGELLAELACMNLSEFKCEPFNGPKVAVGQVLAQIGELLMSWYRVVWGPSSALATA